MLRHLAERVVLLAGVLAFLAGESVFGKPATEVAAAQPNSTANPGTQNPAAGKAAAPGSPASAAVTYYFISDMHIGGDAGLDKCHFENKLIEFLKKIADGPKPAELIIVGDAFGMWELTDVRGNSKLAQIASTHQDLFAQFRETGQQIKITLLPGNHDYDLACIPSYKAELAQWNIALEPVVHTTREVAGRKIWIEHGNQHDDFNTFPDFGNRYGLPAGYFITTHTVAAAAESAAMGRSPWLNDLESVYPNEEVPAWIWSNYFYREMTPLLRWCLLPFLMLFSVSVLVLVGRALEKSRILPTKIFSITLGDRFGLKGRLVDWVIWVNGVVISFVLVMAIPAYLLSHNIRSALVRYGIERAEGLKIQKESKYLAAAEQVFKKDPAYAIYIYGHTHAVSMRKIGPRYVINTGTWLKRLEHVPAHFRLLPGVFHPSYRLNYFTITQKGKNVSIGYEIVRKKPASDLTWLESLMILGRRPGEGEVVPAETILAAE
jgi:UDP-2,3-diacylglucosamine pyrophosphatase LpxH